MNRNKILAAGTLLLFAPPLQESAGFLGIDWWVWILAGVLLLLLLFIIGYVLQEEPGPPIPERESKMYVTPASLAKSEPNPKSESESDDLKKIEGIGQKVADLLNDAGISTFAELAESDVDKLNQILDAADLQFMDSSSWPEQAALAAKGDWEAFEKITAELKGGRR